MRLTMLPGFLLLLPLAEIAGFVLVGKAVGVWVTLALVMLSFVAGMMLLRRQGIGILQKMSMQGRSGAIPGRELLRPAMLVIAAILLIIPGFISDIIALLIFIPAVRDHAWNYVSRRFVVVGNTGTPRAHTQSPHRDGASTVVDLDVEDYQRNPDSKSPWSGKSLGE
jgi:UPF0716 protein FxsA